MSPLWPERLRIGFAPGRVELVRCRPGLRRAPPVDERAADCWPEAGQPLWAAALEALAGLLAEQPAADLEVTLADRFARYLVVPWNPELLAAADLLAATRQQFERVYGEQAGDWELRVSPGEFGDPALACAVDRRLLAALEQVVVRGGGRRRLVSVEPALVRAFNARRRGIDRDALIALVEPDGVCVAALKAGRWHAVQTRHGLSAEPASLLAQEIALASADVVPSAIELFDLSGGFDGQLPFAWPIRRHDPAGPCPLALAGGD